MNRGSGGVNGDSAPGGVAPIFFTGVYHNLAPSE